MRTIERIEPTIPQIKRKKRVAAYARVSMETDRLNHSLSAQISYYSELIQNNPDWIYVGVYADSGISGTGIKKRTEFRRMLEDCEAGKIDIVLTKSISRFARNTVDLLDTVRHLKSIGVEIRFEKENIHSLTADGELLLTILAGFAEEESRAISENIKWAFRKKFERGEQWHVPPFGYRWNGETFVIDEHEAEAVRKIFDDYLNNSPVAITASWLKERGFPHSKTFITNALKNYVYIGRVITQKSFTENHRTHKRIANVGQLPRYVIDDNHESIIDRETFEEVQRRLENDAAFMKARARPTKRPFGYKWENGGYAIIPKEAEAVKLMYKYYIKGWSVTKISTTLSQHGYHTRTGKLSNRIVDRVLDSDFYIGGKQVKGQNAYELDFKHEPIIDKASFDTVQRLRKERGHNRKEDKP